MDSLFALAEWRPELKADKLADVSDKLARNLLSQRLHNDRSDAMTYACASVGTFVFILNEGGKYDVFLSYRVASDAQHVDKL